MCCAIKSWKDGIIIVAIAKNGQNPERVISVSAKKMSLLRSSFNPRFWKTIINNNPSGLVQDGVTRKAEFL
jgi:hypothetical protein